MGYRRSQRRMPGTARSPGHPRAAIDEPSRRYRFALYSAGPSYSGIVTTLLARSRSRTTGQRTYPEVPYSQPPVPTALRPVTHGDGRPVRELGREGAVVCCNPVVADGDRRARQLIVG
jgi:hypothetical protein